MANSTGPYGPKGVGIGTLYIFLILILLVIGGHLFSGGLHPVNPNGPNGVPTLEPYYNPEDYGVQRIIIPTDSLDASGKKNLQLQTFMVNTCGQKTAVDFLIDTSGSMEDDGKMEKAKSALREFARQIGGKTVIGIHTFSKDVKERVPLSYYKDVKGEVAKTIDDLRPDGWTRTRDGFELVGERLATAIMQNKFPDYKYNLILITDGVPEIPPPQPDDRDCYIRVDDPITAPAKRCFAKKQDPRIPTNLAERIKALDPAKGIDIYSIGIYSETSSDRQLKPYLEALLKDVASKPLDTHYYDSLNANDLKKIFENVIDKICEAENFM